VLRREVGVSASASAADLLDHPGVKLIVNLTIPAALCQVASQAVVAASVCGRQVNVKRMRSN
jgi:hypothetical protein